MNGPHFLTDLKKTRYNKPDYLRGREECQSKYGGDMEAKSPRHLYDGVHVNSSGQHLLYHSHQGAILQALPMLAYPASSKTFSFIAGFSSIYYFFEAMFPDLFIIVMPGWLFPDFFIVDGVHQFSYFDEALLSNYLVLKLCISISFYQASFVVIMLSR